MCGSFVNFYFYFTFVLFYSKIKRSLFFFFDMLFYNIVICDFLFYYYLFTPFRNPRKETTVLSRA